MLVPLLVFTNTLYVSIKGATLNELREKERERQREREGGRERQREREGGRERERDRERDRETERDRVFIFVVWSKVYRQELFFNSSFELFYLTWVTKVSMKLHLNYRKSTCSKHYIQNQGICSCSILFFLNARDKIPIKLCIYYSR